MVIFLKEPFNFTPKRKSFVLDFLLMVFNKSFPVLKKELLRFTKKNLRKKKLKKNLIEKIFDEFVLF